MAAVPRLLGPAGGNPSLAVHFFPTQTICRSCLRRYAFNDSLQKRDYLNPQVRLYAKISHTSSSEQSSVITSSSLEPSKQPSDPNLSWPTPNKANPYEIPTPYEIFQIAPDAPYSKRRFYELVKLYHPDRAQSSSNSDQSPHRLSQAARLERYRMVIAANELLSDSRRRRAYDKHGVGWDGKPGFGPNKPRWADANNRHWSGFDDNVNDSPRGNATWEDWEQWQMRQERTQGEQKETFTSNGTFVAIIIIAAGFATVGESVRMSGHNRTMLQQVEQRHDTNSKELIKRRKESQDFIARDERMRRFLMLRGPVGTEVQLKAVGQEKEGSEFISDHDAGR